MRPVQKTKNKTTTENEEDINSVSFSSAALPNESTVAESADRLEKGDWLNGEEVTLVTAAMKSDALK